MGGIFLAVLIALAGNGDTEFRNGIAAYRAGDLKSALASFQRALELGVRNPNLDFDLGLTLYRLGDYAQARVQFERLAQDPQYRWIATYHLGLVDARTGEDEQAIARLRQVEAESDSPRLRDLAEVALRRIGAQTAAPTIAAYAAIALGYDSNPLLVSEALRQALDERADAFASIQGGVEVPIAATNATLLSARADLYAREYLRDDDLDQQGAEAALREQFGDAWRTDVSLLGTTAFVGGDNLENSGGIGARVAHTFGDSTLRIGYRLDRIEGGSVYRYLTGWRHRVTADDAFALLGTRARVDYEFEIDDRRDLEQDGQFFSQSPIRHGIGIRDRRDLTDSLELEARARYRRSDYRDPDAFLDGTTLIERTRRENLMQAAIAGRWRFTSAWNLLLEYEYSNNRSNFAGFTYDRHVVTLGVEWLR